MIAECAFDNDPTKLGKASWPPSYDTVTIWAFRRRRWGKFGTSSLLTN